MEIKINDEIIEFIKNAIATHSGIPIDPYLSAETLRFIKLLLTATASPSGKIKKKELPREFISPDDSMSFSISDYVEAGLLNSEKAKNGREFLYVTPKVWEIVNLNKVVVREIARQRRAEYRAKSKPTGAGAKRWTAKKVKELLETADWNGAEAAKMVGIKRQYISFLMKKFGIKKPE